MVGGGTDDNDGVEIMMVNINVSTISSFLDMLKFMMSRITKLFIVFIIHLQFYAWEFQ